MRQIILAATTSLIAAGAYAGGIERSTFSSNILFEDGRYFELSFGAVSPTVDGTFMGLSSGDMAPSFFSFGAGYKADINDSWSYAIILDQPVGADVDYSGADAGYPFLGSTAEVDSLALTGIIKYTTPQNFSVYGGVRAQSVKGNVTIPLFGPYTLTTNNDLEFGYLVGAAWEKPEIAARVALTYISEIEHTFDTVEFGAPSAPFSTIIPESITLDFQSGVAADTLVFGSVRWVDWSEFDVTPVALGTFLVDYPQDVTTYTLGVGRRFNENWSGAVIIGYEDPWGVPVGNLDPTDGQKSVGLGVTYTKDNMKITGGVRYIDIGNATTTTIGADFSGNTAIAAGVRVGWYY
jgi:long-chain fatty acid transport protein